MRILVPLLLIISGCATSAKLEERMNSWVGRSVNDLISAQGVPHTTFKMPNGNTVYTWHLEGDTKTELKDKPWSFTGEKIAVTKTDYCELSYTADQQNVITSWRHEGNSCRAP